MIDTRDLARLKQRVRNRIEQLSAAAAQHAGADEQPSDDDAATLDVTINAIVGEQLREGAQQELRALLTQLAWLDGDDAGYCTGCGDRIPLARLEAVPVTRLCIRCAERAAAKKER